MAELKGTRGLCWIHYCPNKSHMWRHAANSLPAGNKDPYRTVLTPTASSLKQVDGHSWRQTAAAIITAERPLSLGSGVRDNVWQWASEMLKWADAWSRVPADTGHLMTAQTGPETSWWWQRWRLSQSSQSSRRLMRVIFAVSKMLKWLSRSWMSHDSVW